MRLEGTSILLRIFLGEGDNLHGKPVYEHILHAAREAGLAGATVLRGVAGFGAVSRVIHTAKVLRLSEDLPMIVEIVDSEERVNGFIPTVENFFETANCGGLITIERVEIIKYTHGK